MRIDCYGPREERWYREGHAARTVAGLPRVFVFPLRTGAVVALIPAHYGPGDRETAFMHMLTAIWSERDGPAIAAARMADLTIGD